MLLLESEICLLCSENKTLIDAIGEKRDFMRNVKIISVGEYIEKRES